MPMIPFEDNYLSQEQAQAIIRVLEHQCNLIEEKETRDERDFPELYNEEYISGRTHTRTAQIYAGFHDGNEILDMSITKIKYGKNLYQPQLESDIAIIQMYSSKASLDIDEIKRKCSEYNTEESEKRYIALRFYTSKRGHLTQVQLVHFDKDARIISKTPIYKFRADIIEFVA